MNTPTDPHAGIYHIEVTRVHKGYRATVGEMPGFTAEREHVSEALSLVGHLIDTWLRQDIWEAERAEE